MGVPPNGTPAPPKATRRYVTDDDFWPAVTDRETEVLDALGIAWNSLGHIKCPYGERIHADKNPSWRWDRAKRKGFCT